MKRSTKTALGIDISETHITMALLKGDGNAVELLKAARGPVPDGAIKNGNVEDPTILSRAIKQLKTRNKIQARQAAVSLLARPVLVQIMDMPKQVPTNIGQFVQNEVKQCVALSGRKIASDFCGVGSRAGRRSHLFVVATDGQKVADIVRVCKQAGVGVETIEPPLLAYARAFHAKKIARKFDCNVLLAILQSSVLTLCVFRKESVDFVRTKDISEEKAEPDKLCQQLADHINAIIQFYDTDVPNNSGKWEITVVVNDVMQWPEDAEEFLKAQLGIANLQVRTPENACQDTPVGQNNSLVKAEASVVAVGLAMQLLTTNQSNNLRINLLPSEIDEVKSLRKHAVVTANIAAVILFLMVSAVGGLTLITERVNENIIREKQGQPLQYTSTLFRKEKLIEGQIEWLSDRINRMNGVLGSLRDVDWVHILNDIRSGTPSDICITNLFSEDGSRLFLEGLALSYEAVHLFVDMMDKSEHIDSVSLIKAEKDNREDGLVRYTISCILTARKGK